MVVSLASVALDRDAFPESEESLGLARLTGGGGCFGGGMLELCTWLPTPTPLLPPLRPPLLPPLQAPPLLFRLPPLLPPLRTQRQPLLPPPPSPPWLGASSGSSKAATTLPRCNSWASSFRSPRPRDDAASTDPPTDAPTLDLTDALADTRSNLR